MNLLFAGCAIRHNRPDVFSPLHVSPLQTLLRATQLKAADVVVLNKVRVFFSKFDLRSGQIMPDQIMVLSDLV